MDVEERIPFKQIKLIGWEPRKTPKELCSRHGTNLAVARIACDPVAVNVCTDCGLAVGIFSETDEVGG